MSQSLNENGFSNQRKRPPSETLLYGQGAHANKTNRNSDYPTTTFQSTIQNTITPATTSQTAVNHSSANHPVTNNAITPVTARPSTAMLSKTSQEVYQDSNQSILDMFVLRKTAKFSALAKDQCNKLNKSILDKKQRLEDEAKRDTIVINLICPKQIGLIDEPLQKQLHATKSHLLMTEMHKQELKSQLSAMSKKMIHASNCLNNQLAEHQDNAEQAIKDCDDTQ